MHPMHVVLCLCAHVFLCVHVCCKPFIYLIFTVLFVQIHVQIKFPEPTKLGLEFLRSKGDETFNVYPEADMLLSMNKCTSYSTFTEWGKGWADPEIRRQRLEKMRQKPDGSHGKQKQRKSRVSRKSRSRKSNKNNSDLRTVRGRIEAKLSKYKWQIKVIELMKVHMYWICDLVVLIIQYQRLKVKREEYIYTHTHYRREFFYMGLVV